MVIQLFFSGETHSSAKFSVHLVISAPEIRVPLPSALQVWKSSVVPDQLACVDATKIKITFLLWLNLLCVLLECVTHPHSAKCNNPSVISRMLNQ